MDALAGNNPWIPREHWEPYDPMLISEGAFAAGMIFSFLKLVHIFSVNPHLGPLQISLGRMIIDILKFFFIYSLVLFAFGCGLNQLLWYYANIEKNKCYHLPNGMPDYDQNEKACSIWRRYANLFETSQSLFWASFGLVDLMNFELTGIKEFTRFWALLMFGSYSVINIIVLLNMLIAMMSNSYQMISERADVEWKFARSKLWVSYFEEGDTVPPPFNIFPTPKTVTNAGGCVKDKRQSKSFMSKSRERAEERHACVLRQIVRRYVTAEQRKRDDYGITEDDVMEIRQDISTLRYELIEILRDNGMRTPNINMEDANLAGKKGRVMERRLLKNFTIGTVEGVQSIIGVTKEPRDVFSQIAKVIGKRQSQKKEWNTLVRQNTQSSGNPIGTTSEAALRQSRGSLRKYILTSNTANTSIDQDKLLEFNPNLVQVPPTARLAYAKFMNAKLKQEIAAKEFSTTCTPEKHSILKKSFSRDDSFQSNGSANLTNVLKGLNKQLSFENEGGVSTISKERMSARTEIILSPSPILEAENETDSLHRGTPDSLASMHRATPESLGDTRPTSPIPKLHVQYLSADEPDCSKSFPSKSAKGPAPNPIESKGSSSNLIEIKEPLPMHIEKKEPLKLIDLKEPPPIPIIKEPIAAPKPSPSHSTRPTPSPTPSNRSKISGFKRTDWL